MLQEREVRRLGGKRAVKIDVRVICATNKDLQSEVSAERFRADLYYRLNVVRIVIPPLRERKEDIPLLADHFLRKYSLENGKNVNRISEEAMSLLVRHGWPGNVRELENAIERAVVVTKTSRIEPQDLPTTVTKIRTDMLVNPHGSLAEIERQHVISVLQKNDWQVKKSAQELGIDRSTLYAKMRKYAIKRPKS